MPVPRAGTRLPTSRGESFVIGRTLGTGGMGTVVEATHAPSGRRVALKLLHDELRDHPTIPKRFMREVEFATSLSTAHVARTFGVERAADGTVFMVMELLEGRDLHAILRAEGALPVARAASLVAQACEALEEAHARGIIHRDLKPENLFVCRAADGGDWVKVLDFGISKAVDDEWAGGMPGGAGGAGGPRAALTRVGTTVGTPEYMAPEQLRGARDLDAGADVYSLGVVLYEALCARRPFVAESYDQLARKIGSERPPPVSKLRGDVPPALSEVVGRAMARDRAARTPSARTLREELAPFASGGRKAEGTVVMDVTSAQDPPRPPVSPPSPRPPPPPAGPRGSPATVTSSDEATVTAGRSGTRIDTVFDDASAGMGRGFVALIAVVGLLMIVAVAALVWPQWLGLH